MDCWAIIPVKPFRAGKSRLAGLLGTAERTALNRRLFGRVLDAVLGAFSPARVVVVTADAALRALTHARGLHHLDDTHDDLNAALALASRCSVARGARATMILPSDLPTVTTDDVRALLAMLGPAPGCVIAPDEHEQGTNALVLAPPADDFFHFGPKSFELHIEAARARGITARILRRPGLAYDLDTPEAYRRYAKLDHSGAIA